uniref:Nuclear pore complex protein n=1 Tax=Tetraselmis chuii TaxID=63592 RepID=A0A7S1X2S4_9CHLO|mmetsp:Transcript_24669/g.43936  ORF Transcript_24669/g.43936 Transcript_24669/m.43936 type:complete len:954 (+) Transcript_24669:149-3010(+)
MRLLSQQADPPVGPGFRPGFEDSLAEQIERLLEGCDPVDVLSGLEWFCREYAEAVRDDASSQLHRAARHICLRSEADDIEGEAATWCLLRHLFDANSFADGGVDLPRVGVARTRRQRAAAIVAQEHSINVSARVVAWLECLSSQTLHIEESLSQRAGGASAYAGRFASRESVWRSTKSKVARGLDGDWLSTELDPDGPSRSMKSLDSDNAKDEDRLMANCWRYLRSGRIAAMLELCSKCGQPWRLASLSGGSLSGMITPVSGESGWSVAQQRTALAVEAEDGCGDLHSLLKWTAFQAAEQAAVATEGTGGGSGGGDYEAAVYAALCGHVARMLKVCKTWEDACWAYFRTYLDVSLDSKLQPPSIKSDWSLAESECCKVLGRHAPKQRNRVAESAKSQAEAVVGGQWPLSTVLDQVPHSIEECFTKVKALHLPSNESVVKKLQTQLILAKANEQADSFEVLLKDLSIQVDRHIQQTMFSADQKGSKSGDEKSHFIRFAAHLAILLDSLLPTDSVMHIDLGAQQNAVNNLVQCYVVKLVEERHHKLIPLYSCKLRPVVRELAYNIYLQTVEDDSMEDCQSVYEISRDCFRKHGVHRDDGVIADEMCHLVLAYTRKVLAAFDVDPFCKVSSVRWLVFGKETEEWAVQHAVFVCRGLLLGEVQSMGNRMAKKLFEDILPADFLSQNISPELEGWRSYFTLQSEIEDWEAQYQTGMASKDASNNAVLAEVVKKVPDIVERGVCIVCSDWMTSSSSAMVTDEYTSSWLQMAVSPFPQSESPASEVELMPNDVAGRLADLLQHLWSSELQGWAVEQLGQDCSVDFSADVVQDGPSPVSIKIQCNSLAPHVALVLGQVASALLQGHASGSPEHELNGLKLRAHTFEASEDVAHALCRQMLVPSLLLQLSKMKTVHAQVVGPSAVFQDLVMLVSDSFHSLFSTKQLQEFIESERRGRVASLA